MRNEKAPAGKILSHRCNKCLSAASGEARPMASRLFAKKRIACSVCTVCKHHCVFLYVQCKEFMEKYHGAQGLVKSNFRSFAALLLSFSKRNMSG